MAINVQNVERFKFIAHKIIPLVYDDSLSYYEFLCKVMQKLNEVISSLDNQNEILEAFDEEILEWETSTDNKYNKFVNNINTLFEAFKQGEVAARTAFMDALIGSYNASTHYAIGQYVRYGNSVYKCTTATSGEAWNPAHWMQVIYADDLSERQSDYEESITGQQNAFETAIIEQQNDFESSMQEQWDEFFDRYLETLGVVQTTGTSTTDVMSQKAVTDELNVIKEKLINDEQLLYKKIDTGVQTSTPYYNTLSKITANKKVKLLVKSSTSGNYTLAFGTGEIAEDMVDTVYTGNFVANTPIFIDYTPTGDYSKARLSSGTSWTISVYEEKNVWEQIDENSNNIIKLQNDLTNKTNPVVSTSEGYVNVPLEIKTDGFYNLYGTFILTTGRSYAVIDSVTTGDNYKITTFIRSTQIPAILYFNEDVFISYEKLGTGSDEYLTDYSFTIPNNCTKLVVQSAATNAPFSLTHFQTIYESKSYYKEETDSKYVHKYGIKWKITDNDDLGERCFDAIGLKATIGVGETDGYSDFNNIYPWCEMKRCNIKTNNAGATIVIYEGEDGFSLDGSNGDVFVRIPKFKISRYKDDEYEYRVIGVGNTHEAFIENGNELDEIFIGAFEGYINADNKLKSIAGVIPTSNEYPSTFLEKAKANGNNYSLYDNRCVDVIWTLMAIEFGCRNTNQIIGYGLADFLQPIAENQIIESSASTNSIKVNKLSASAKQYIPVGSNITICRSSQTEIIAQRKIISVIDGDDYTSITFDGDALSVDSSTDFYGSAAFNTNFCESAPTGEMTTYHTGRANWATSSVLESKTRNPIRYRWIENVVGNLWHYLPDVTFKDLQMYQCKNMSDYVFHKYTDSYLPVGDTLVENTDNGSKADVAGSNYWVTSLLNDTFAKSVDFGKTYDKSLVSTKAFGAYYYLFDEIVCIANGGGFDHLWRCNVLTQRAWIQNDNKWYLYGARLMFKKVN